MAENPQTSLPMEATPQAPHPSEETPQILESIQPQGTAPDEASQQDRLGEKRRRGRQKISMQRIENDNDRMVTFSKRREGLYKKGTEISTRCGAQVGIVMFSPAGNPYGYGSPDIESITDRFLGRVNPEAQDHNRSRFVVEAERRAHMGRLNKEYDELTVYLQSLKEEGDELMQLKKQKLDPDCWWEIPVEDLDADEMQRMAITMQELEKNASKRVGDLRAGASSSSAVVQLEDTQTRGNEGRHGYVRDGGFGNFTEGGSLSAVVGVQGGVMETGGNLGQGYRKGVGGSGGFADSRAGGSTAAGIQGGGFQSDGNGGLGGFRGAGVGGFGDRGASSSGQTREMQMGGNGAPVYGGGVGGGFGDFTVGGSAAVSIQEGGLLVGKYKAGGFGGGNVAGVGIGQQRPVGSAAASSAVQPGVGSTLVGGKRINRHGGSVGVGFGDFMTGGFSTTSIQEGGLPVGKYEGGGFGGGDVAGGGIGQRRPVVSAVASSAVQPGVGSMHVGGSRINRHGGGVGGGFRDFMAGGLSTASIQGGLPVRKVGGGGFGSGDAAVGGNGQRRPDGSAATSSAFHPSVGSMLVCGKGVGNYGGSVTAGGGISDGWKPINWSLSGGWKPVNSSLGGGLKPINSSSTLTTIKGANPMQIASGGGGGVGGGGLGDWGTVRSSSMHMGGNRVFGCKDIVGGSSVGGHGDWKAAGSSTMRIGGNGGFGNNNNVGGSAGGASRGLGGWGAGGASSSLSLQPNPMQMSLNGGPDYGGLGGGAGSVFGGDRGGFGNFTAGGSSSVALQPDQDRGQLDGTSNGGSFYDGGDEFDTNYGFV